MNITESGITILALFLSIFFKEMIHMTEVQKNFMERIAAAVIAILDLLIIYFPC